ncbi:MAG: hypothetical protein WCI92_15655 [Bacteroidota bacterium]
MTNHIIRIAILALLTVSCKHEPMLPPMPGDISYVKDIAPIMKRSCAYSGCHMLSNNVNFPLETYSDLINYGSIVPFKPLESDLYDVIARAYMPLGTTKLSLADQKLVYDWISKGALDN